MQTAVSVAVAVGVAPSRATVGNRSVALLGITRRGAARPAGAWADMPDAKDMTTDLHKAMFPDRFRLGPTTLPQATKVKVREYWTSATTPSPLTKGQIRDRLAPNVYEVHATHWVFDTFTTVYNEYMALHSVGHPLCQRLFEELRPYFVKPFCARQRQTCMCIYHLSQCSQSTNRSWGLYERKDVCCFHISFRGLVFFLVIYTVLIVPCKDGSHYGSLQTRCV